jgi:hypothetical protein
MEIYFLRFIWVRVTYFLKEAFIIDVKLMNSARHGKGHHMKCENINQLIQKAPLKIINDSSSA